MVSDWAIAHVRSMNKRAKPTPILPPSDQPTPRNFAVVREIDPDTVVHVSSGGGYEFFLDFLMGKSPGYHTDADVYGVMVTPFSLIDGSRERDAMYAYRTPLQLYLQEPAVLTFEVQANYLEVVRNYGYETALRHDLLGQIRNIEIKPYGYSPAHRYRDVAEMRATFR